MDIYIRSDAQVERDKLIKLANEKYVVHPFQNCLVHLSFFSKYSDQHAKLAAYLTWPDARLRAYLREKGVTGDLPNLLRTLASWYLKIL
jgi:hypothetical protein